jgi:hypothetical protein
MSSMRFNARLDASHHGPPHPYKDAGVVKNRLTGIHNATVKCLFVVNRSCIHTGFDAELCLSPRWVGCNIGSTDATKTCHTLNAYIFETNNRKAMNDTSLDSL